MELSKGGIVNRKKKTGVTRLILKLLGVDTSFMTEEKTQVGRDVHDIIERFLKGEVRSEEELNDNHLKSFIKFAEEYKLKVQEIELYVENEHVRGRLDLLATLEINGEEKLFLLDIKTGGFLYYNEYQLHIYRLLYKEMTGCEREIHCGLVPIKEDSYELRISPNDPNEKIAKSMLEFKNIVHLDDCELSKSYEDLVTFKDLVNKQLDIYLEEKKEEIVCRSREESFKKLGNVTVIHTTTVDVFDESLIPEEFFTNKTTVNKKEILKKLRAGKEIKGAKTKVSTRLSVAKKKKETDSDSVTQESLDSLFNHDYNQGA